jgi:NhaA family Na+:H+ antiporter
MIKKFLIIEDFISKEALSGILLFIATVAAVIVANSSFGDKAYYDLWHMPLELHLEIKQFL